MEIVTRKIVGIIVGKNKIRTSDCATNQRTIITISPIQRKWELLSFQPRGIYSGL